MKYSEAKTVLMLLNKMSVIDVKIPIQTAIKILKNKQLLSDAVLPYNELEDSIFKQYSNGKSELTPADAEWEECNSKTQEVLNSEITVEFTKINLSELDGLNLPMSAVTALYPMLEVTE